MKALLALALLGVGGACHVTKSTVATPEPTAQLAARRAQIIGWLHDYREAGSYPVDDAGMPLSAFTDSRGVRCPMAEMIHKSGRDDLVAAVTAEANTVRLADVHSGPLYDWMLASGLTQDEIALVQGAMEISYAPFIEQTHEVQMVAARAAVRAKLEVAEVALRNGTAASLTTARQRLPDNARPDQLAASKIAGRVVPRGAVPRQLSGPAIGFAGRVLRTPPIVLDQATIRRK